MKLSIFKYSLWYSIVRLYVKVAYYLYYSKVEVIGRENIPKNRPVIFAANHSNGLMDALAFVCTVNRQVVFLSRADIFSSPFISRVLNFFKILPVYRQRDGIKSVSKNEEIFRIVKEGLCMGKALCMMPEGTHHGGIKLLPLQTGIFRLAIETAKMRGGEDVIIIPTGLRYEHPKRFRSKVSIIFGNPISVSELMHLSEANASKLLKDMLTNSLTRLAGYTTLPDSELDVANFALNVPSVKAVKKSEVIKYSNTWVLNRFENIFNNSPIFYKELSRNVSEYNELLLRSKIKPFYLLQFQNSIFLTALSALLLLITLPVFIIGISFHALPLLFAHVLNLKNEDYLFHSSVRFVIWLLWLPFQFTMLTLVLIAIGISISTLLAILFMIVMSGILALFYLDILRNAVVNIACFLNLRNTLIVKAKQKKIMLKLFSKR
ncbi:MAG TPA: lysophospholipid acyltransferase family protein [Bacteroidales bacterium]|nr:lysophospholipid acyltransferase family protein [Bacteroidales bacterium]